jgi:general secretion pathway protein C
MPAILSDRSNFAQTALVSLATLAALALLGLVLAYWSWAWLAPRAEARAPPVQPGGALGAAGAAQSAYGLFGGRKQERNGAAAASSAISLLGVVADSDGRSGYAVLRLDAKRSVTVHEGAEVEAGVRLAEVHARHVVLDRNGVRESLALPERPGDGAPGKP